MSLAELATKFNLSKSTIHYIIQRYKTHSTTRDFPRSGRPQLFSPHQAKIIHRKARAAPNLAYSELAKVAQVVSADGTCSKLPSHRTLHRCLNKTTQKKANIMTSSSSSSSSPQKLPSPPPHPPSPQESDRRSHRPTSSAANLHDISPTADSGSTTRSRRLVEKTRLQTKRATRSASSANNMSTSRY
jgi:hypothetical protein